MRCDWCTLGYRLVVREETWSSQVMHLLACKPGTVASLAHGQSFEGYICS
jgi:hypothetical protein